MCLSLFIGTQKVKKSHTVQKLPNGPDISIRQVSPGKVIATIIAADYFLGICALP